MCLANLRNKHIKLHLLYLVTKHLGNKMSHDIILRLTQIGKCLKQLQDFTTVAVDDQSKTWDFILAIKEEQMQQRARLDVMYEEILSIKRSLSK